MTQWSLRFSAIAALAAAFSWGAPARGQDVVAEVHSIDVENRSMMVFLPGAKDPTRIVLTEQTRIEAGGDRQVKLDQLRPGTRIVIRNQATASHIRIPDEVIGHVIGYNAETRVLSIREDISNDDVDIVIEKDATIEAPGGREGSAADFRVDSHAIVAMLPLAATSSMHVARRVIIDAYPVGLFEEALHNFRKNLFKPLLLFFFMGFLVPILRVQFEFPYMIYQGLTIYLLIAIGWKGGEELAELGRHDPGKLLGAVGFMGVGFLLNFVNGILAYLLLSLLTRLRRIDKATVAGYYGSDSAGTFVTCVGALASANILFDAYMPVMLAVMEIPGCLVALFLVSRLRARGLDPQGNMPDEPGYDPNAMPLLPSGTGHDGESAEDPPQAGGRTGGFLSPKLLHEVFLNPGLYLLFGGIAIGFASGMQGKSVTRDDDNFFIALFQGVLCLFLLEMGMTASRKLKDLRTAGPGFIAFGLVAPPLFAALGIAVAHAFALLTRTHFELGTYVLFSVLCAAASYIAVPAVQRLAIPEASPTLPLASSLGMTFTLNVTIGIPVYILIAKAMLRAFPVT
ncbi:MAG: sodium-dependent bicarbonate transport family permease [Isosphaeraceae bacterium]